MKHNREWQLRAGDPVKFRVVSEPGPAYLTGGVILESERVRELHGRILKIHVTKATVQVVSEQGTVRKIDVPLSACQYDGG